MVRGKDKQVKDDGSILGYDDEKVEKRRVEKKKGQNCARKILRRQIAKIARDLTKSSHSLSYDTHVLAIAKKSSKINQSN
jgi:hypothetical protein